MSYLDSHADPAARAKAVAAVVGVHALMAAGLVAGLAVTAYVIEDKHLPTTEFPLDPPPQPQQTDQPTDTSTYIPPKAPSPKDTLSDDSTITVDTFDGSMVEDTILTIPTPAPTPDFVPRPSPSPRYAPVGARPRNGPAGWINSEDYARSDIIRENEGTASYRLVIGSDGRVDACEITASSGHDSLDRITCRLIERRARFDPAKDGDGRSVVGTFTGQVTWRLPE